jgi:hypothetical protein
MIDIMVTLGSQFAGLSEKIAKVLSQDGLIVDRVYPFGVIKGRANAQVINKLRDHKEVEEVKEERTIKIAPPGNTIQ